MLKPGLVTSYDLWPGNGAGPILQLPEPTRGVDSTTSVLHSMLHYLLVPWCT